MPKVPPVAPGNKQSKYWRRPLDADRVKVPHGELHILVDRCKGCMFCVEYCPRDVLEMSEDYNAKGYHFPVADNDPACVNCRLCEMLCPEFAIFCLEVKEGEGETQGEVGKKGDVEEEGAVDDS